MHSKEFAYLFVWGSALLTVFSIASLAYTSKGGFKPVHIIAMIAVIGGVATLYKELGSSEKTDAIKTTGENTNKRVIELEARNQVLQATADTLSQANTQLKDKADSLLHESRTQTGQLLAQGRQLVTQSALLVKQDGLLVRLREENLNKTAREEALVKETLERDKQRLKQSINLAFSLILKTRTNPIKYRTLEENRDWTKQALALFESEYSNSYLKQDKAAFNKWNDAINALRRQSSFLVDPKFMKTRDFTEDEATSKMLLIKYLNNTHDKVSEATRYIQIP